MPNRDHDDTPYNRSEGRFEGQRDERDQGARSWDRRDEVRAGERYRTPYGSPYGSPYGNQYGSGYNPSRDDYDFRGGSRFDERGRYAQGGFRERDDQRSWDDDARWRDRMRNYRADSGSYRADSSGYRADLGSSRTEWPRDEAVRSIGSQGNYGGHDWNRDYTRDWDRDYRGDASQRFSGNREQDQGDWGEQLRHAGHQMIGRVKRAFRGPKGYKRSDERIREDVNDRLAQQDEFDPSEVEVRVENGDVTLTGSVRNRHEKFRAEEIADDVSGVNEVHNQLRIGAAQAQTSTSTSTSATTTNAGTSQISRNGRA